MQPSVLIHQGWPHFLVAKLNNAVTHCIKALFALPFPTLSPLELGLPQEGAGCRWPLLFTRHMF